MAPIPRKSSPARASSTRPRPAGNAVKVTAVLPKLLALDRDTPTFEDQISEAARLIGLPEGWKSATAEVLAEASKGIVRARAEWVLRYLLGKMRSDDGAAARADPNAWKLLRLMISIVAATHAATHLRDPGTTGFAFLEVVEKSLQENFDQDVAGRPSPAGATDISESSETVGDEQPSRKRKRSSGIESSSKKVAVQTSNPDILLRSLVGAVNMITEKANAIERSGDTISAQHLRMVLAPESAQAARILKFWLTAVLKVLKAQPDQARISAPFVDDFMNFASIVENWDLRVANATAEDAVDQFSSECLTALLALHDEISHNIISSVPAMWTQSWDELASFLERLLARYLFSPSRVAFARTSSGAGSSNGIPPKAELFSENISPLRAKIEQAAETYDATHSIPASFEPYFRVIPSLLDMAIRFSPSRTPKANLTEAAWRQAVFLSLTECVGCALEVPRFKVPEASIQALQATLRVLAAQNVSIEPGILEDLFWYHSGVQPQQDQPKCIRWPLIASLIEAEPDVFLPLKATRSTSDSRPEDITRYLFDQISSIPPEALDEDQWRDASPRTGHDVAGLLSTSHKTFSTLRQAIGDLIATPLISAFARNRDLLGFISRWDEQLCEVASTIRSALSKHDEKNVLSIWEYSQLESKRNVSLARLLERSVTQSQIVALFKQYDERVTAIATLVHDDAGVRLTSKKHRKAFRSACAGSIILNVLIDSIDQEETLESIGPQLCSLIKSYSYLVQTKAYRASADLALSWVILSQIYSLLEPMRRSGRLSVQDLDLDVGALGKAANDFQISRKAEEQEHTNSASRAAAASFLFVVSHHSQDISPPTKNFRKLVSQTTSSISSMNLEPPQLMWVLEQLCGRYTCVFAYVEPDKRESFFGKLLKKFSKVEIDARGGELTTALSASILRSTDSQLKESFQAALLKYTKDKDVKAEEIVAARSLPQKDVPLLELNNPDDFLRSSLLLISQGNSVQEHRNARKSIQQVLRASSPSKRVSTIKSFFDMGDMNSLLDEDKAQCNAAPLYLLHDIISSLPKDGAEIEEQKAELLKTVPRICSVVASHTETTIFNAGMDCIEAALKDRPILLSQHNIENILSTIVLIASPSSPALPGIHAPDIYARVCEILRLIILLHRARLGGRFHLLIQVLQSLLACLFVPNAGRANHLPLWLRAKGKPLTPQNASQYAKILSTLCTPTVSSLTRHHRRDSTNLKDPIREAKIYASQYLPPVLGFFCRQQLNGRLEPSVRDKLMPGIWEVCAVANLDRGCLDGMFAGLNQGSRAIWKGVWEEWGKVKQ